MSWLAEDIMLDIPRKLTDGKPNDAESGDKSPEDIEYEKDMVVFDAAIDSWKDQTDSEKKKGVSMPDIPELPRIALWGIATVLLVLGLWRLYSVSVLSAVVLIGAAVVISPLVLEYSNQLVKIVVTVVLLLLSFVMPNQIISHEPGDTIITVVQNLAAGDKQTDNNSAEEQANAGYMGTGLTKEQFDKKYQNYKVKYKGQEGVKPEDAEVLLQDFLYNKDGFFANEIYIDLKDGKKETVEYQVINVQKASDKKAILYIKAGKQKYKLTVTKKKDAKIKLDKKKIGK